jgi:DNA-binding XRE family transcriptional regulator
MSNQKIKNSELRKDIGLRFKEFRKYIQTNQYELAKKLNSCQSTITNIETGKIYPGIPLFFIIFFLQIIKCP